MYRIQIVIVDGETRKRKPDLEVGEIWVDSPSKAIGCVTQHYVNRAQTQAEVTKCDLQIDFLYEIL